MWFKFIFLVLNLMTQIYCTPSPRLGSIQSSGNSANIPEENTNVNLKSLTIKDRINETAAKCGFQTRLLELVPEYFCNIPFVPRPFHGIFRSDELTLCIGIFDAVGNLCQKNNTEILKYKNETKPDDQISDFCNDISSTLPEPSFEPTKEWKDVLLHVFGDVKKCVRLCIDEENVRNPLCSAILRINSISMNVGKQKMPVKIGKVSGGTADPKQQPPDQVTGGNNNENPSKPHNLMKYPASTGGDVNKGTSRAYLTEPNKSVKVSDKLPASAIDSTKPPISEDGPQSMISLTPGVDTEENFDETEPEQFATGGEMYQKDKLSEDTSPPLVQQTNPTNNKSVTSTVVREPPVSTKKNDVPMTQSNNKVEPPDNSGIPDGQVPLKIDNSSFSATLNVPPTILPESDITSKKSGNKTIPDVNASKEDTEKLSDDKMDDLLNDEQTSKLGTSSNNYEDAVPDSVQSQETQVNQEMEPDETKGFVVPSHFVNAEDSHFFAYFVTMMIFCVIAYLVFHNKQKILALALEGRSRRGTRRRPNTSGYRKLDSNLEEAVTSTCSTSVTHVIY